MVNLLQAISQQSHEFVIVIPTQLANETIDSTGVRSSRNADDSTLFGAD